MINNPGGSAGSEDLLGSLTFAGESNQTLSSLAVYRAYRVVYSNVGSSADTIKCRIQVNGITTNTYYTTYHTGNSVATEATAAGYAFITMMTYSSLTGEVYISGKSGSTSGQIDFNGGGGDTSYGAISGVQDTGTNNTQVNAIKIISDSGNIAHGVFKIYGVK